MTVTSELIEKAKLNQGLESDYQLAAMLKIDRQKISNWKNRSEANAEMTLKLMELGNVSVKEGVKKYEDGFSSISMMIVIALFSAVYFLGITQPPHKAHVNAVQQDVTMYIMLNRQ